MFSNIGTKKKSILLHKYGSVRVCGLVIYKTRISCALDEGTRFICITIPINKYISAHNIIRLGYMFGAQRIHNIYVVNPVNIDTDL